MPSTPATRIAEPLLGGPDGIHRGSASAVYLRGQAFVLAGILGITTFLALALQGPCLSSGYERPSASARMCAGPLSTACLGQFNPEAVGRARGGASGVSVLDGVLVDVFRLISDDVSVFMAFVLLLNVVGVAALGVALLLLARRRAWLVAVFASPVILFTLGSTLDPLALALSLWAVVLVVAPAPVTPRPWLAGILLAIAAFENPLALLVLAVSRRWVLIAWALAEAVFAIAIQLGDVTGIDPSKGLEPSFIALFSLLRLFALIIVVVFAGENLYRRRVRGRLRPRIRAAEPATGDADSEGAGPRADVAAGGNDGAAGSGAGKTAEGDSGGHGDSGTASARE